MENHSGSLGCLHIRLSSNNVEQGYCKPDFAVQEWTLQKKRGIWLRLDLSQAALLPVAVQAGFDFKHAESGHMILSKWLPSEVPNLLPEGATHQVSPDPHPSPSVYH